MRFFVVILPLFWLPYLRGGLPEEHMTTAQLAEYYGYPFEEIDATTPDGYVLRLHRIPFGINQEPKKGRPVFFLQHGLVASSADWVTNLPTQSLGFLLADAGFDVWMGNVRGNVYSREHLNYSQHDKQYWQFTWDEMAQYDLPTMIDTALNITKQHSLYYVGHSQGTEMMFARLADDQKFEKKIRKFFALAPVSTIRDIKGILSYLGKYLGRFVWLFEKLFGSHNFFPSNWMSKLFARVVCGERWENPLCDNFLFQVGGPESAQFNQTRLMVYLSHTPAGTSTWNILHWAQMYRSGTVQKFDFGSEALNLKHYGQITPPLYNTSLVNAKTYIYYSDADWLADSTDVENSLLTKIPNEYIKLAKKLPNFNHFDFIWGLHAPKQIYAGIIETAQRHNEYHVKFASKRN